MPTVLQVHDLGISFGGLRAVDSLGFDVEENQLFSVIGPNGAGKTTVFNIISGFYKPNTGSVLFRGTELIGKKPHAVTATGVGRTFQNLELFGRLSVLQNLMVARHLSTRTDFWREIVFSRRTKNEEKAAREASLSILKRLDLLHHADTAINEFPFPVQKRVELGRALALEPKLLLLDEPAAGLNSVETAELSDIIVRIRDEMGITIVLVEHDMSMVMKISERIVVLDHGQKIAEGAPLEVRSNKAVIEAYLGKGSTHAIG